MRSKLDLQALGLLSLILASAGPASAGPASADPQTDRRSTVAVAPTTGPSHSGLHLVRRRAATADSLRPLADGECLAVYTRSFQEPDATAPPEYLALSIRPEVRLDLASSPTEDADSSGRTLLRIQLRPEGSLDLERMTRDNQGRSVAVVIAGEVITVHKIRAVLSDGRIQVSCCSPDACGYLLRRLRESL
jgi:preprotein translocase subunit SecD